MTHNGFALDWSWFKSGLHAHRLKRVRYSVKTAIVLHEFPFISWACTELGCVTKKCRGSSAHADRPLTNVYPPALAAQQCCFTCAGAVVSTVIDQHFVEADGASASIEGVLLSEAHGEGDWLHRRAGVCQYCMVQEESNGSKVRHVSHWNASRRLGCQEQRHSFQWMIKSIND